MGEGWGDFALYLSKLLSVWYLQQGQALCALHSFQQSFLPVVASKTEGPLLALQYVSCGSAPCPQALATLVARSGPDSKRQVLRQACDLLMPLL